ncbi:MAG: hypothetical protein IT285_12855 [Bdellovibrionales bacterium]|nr:hypothetical protein [Bdellovibrionales bacterium]
MRRVPREDFVPPELVSSAYRDRPLPIGQEQTISQPYIVAYMTQAARLLPNDCVLEIGTGCGYQTAILAGLVSDVASVEVREPLSIGTQNRFKKLGPRNVHFKVGDGNLDCHERHGGADSAAPLRKPEHP